MTTVPAHLLIGRSGTYRISGGRAIYTDVDYNCSTARTDKVKVWRWDPGRPITLRYVDWDQSIEVLDGGEVEGAKLTTELIEG
jgi:hypothetical protein